MLDQLRVLHLNMGKRKPVHWSVLNDNDLEHFDAIAIVEPYIYRDPADDKPTQGNHRNWNIYLPTAQRTEGHIRHSYRAAIWTNRTIQAQQIPIDSYDMVAVTITGKQRKLLLIAAYDPGTGVTPVAQAEEEFGHKMRMIGETIEGARMGERQNGGRSSVLVCTDFNRHHPLWGGDRIRYTATELNRAEPVIDMAMTYGLRSALPAGEITYEHQSGETRSTVDVVWIGGEEEGSVRRCAVREGDHGSDHRPIEVTLAWERNENAHDKPRLDWKRADWKGIEGEVEKEVVRAQSHPPPSSPEQLDEWVERFQDHIAGVIRNKVPEARPSPYAKRWWTPELTTLRKTMTTARSQASRLRREGSQGWERQYTAFILVRNRFHQEMEKQKKKHWTEFLEDPDSIWKAHRYTKTGSGQRGIPYLTRTTGERVETDEDKGKMLMETFFPVPPRPQDTTGDQRRREKQNADVAQSPPYDLPPITDHEVQQAIRKANPRKAPGIDGIGFGVWQRLLPVTVRWITTTFQASMRLAYVPRSWKVATIVVLRKPNKPDYTKAKAYRPISLLRTMAKALEAIVASRLSYIVERYNLLPTNHMGGRRKRSSEQAVTVLVEAIREAWRASKVLSLVTFDVQGAFNGVHPEVLRTRLLQRKVPKKLAEWIFSFCTERSAELVIDRYRSAVEPITHAGIPQGSPLSPVLYIFYNANLVEGQIDKKRGSLGFIDDYTAWVVRRTRAETVKVLQEEVIPRAERWARQSGATFEAEKTGLVHFVPPMALVRGRHRAPEVEVENSGLLFLGAKIQPQDSVRVLGVLMDSRLKMIQHVNSITATATRRCLALARLQDLKPKQKRQLFRTAITTKIDYAALAWFSYARRGVGQLINRLERVQRLGAQKILGAFKSTPLATIQSEAGLMPLEDRLHRKVLKQVVNLQTLAYDHPMGRWTRSRDRITNNHETPISLAWREHKGSLRTIPANIQTGAQDLGPAPWMDQPDVEIASSPELAIQADRVVRSGPTVYTDASVRNGVCGIGVVGVPSPDSGRSRPTVTPTTTISITIGREETCSILSAELKAIQVAIESIRAPRTWIASDSQEALRAIQKGERFTRAPEAYRGVRAALARTQETGRVIHFRWVPAHVGVRGNEAADQAAKAATEEGAVVTNEPTRRVTENNLVWKSIQRDLDATERTKTPGPWGKYTLRLDKALPGKHTVDLYDALAASQARILVQARTNHTHLREFKARVRAVPSDECNCSKGKETVRHVLLECEKWSILRTELRTVAGPRWGDLSYILGGYTERKDWRTGKQIDGEKSKWKPNIPIVKATISFLQRTGRMKGSSYEEVGMTQ